MRSEDFHDLIAEQAARQQVLLTAGGGGAAGEQTSSDGPPATNNTSGMASDKSKAAERAPEGPDTKDTVDVSPGGRAVEGAGGTRT
ncbi:hypothetical protein [Methylobacterium sp. CM6257]